MDRRPYSSGIRKVLKGRLFPFDPFEPGFAPEAAVKFFNEIIDRLVKVVARTRNRYGRSLEFKVSFGGKLVFVG